MKNFKKKLINFENKIKKIYEKSLIKAPIHLSSGNEDQLIKIFKNIKRGDWVISNWRSHYHALLHGIPEKKILKEIVKGKSMSLNFKQHKFVASSIVAGGIPIGLGIAVGIKRKKQKNKVFIFVGDMTFETGVFHEAYKYAKNYKLPVKFIVEDNGLSTNTPTKDAWRNISKKPKDVLYYKYKRGYPHHGTGSWVLF
ncbi:thiamine pyrophosphate-dependent enzyme [Candidatus Pelagibacter sp.]|nr:thiamine pyrophosphate-dependent enzyme [Candidatus Pelagibacter sp.]